VAQVSGIRPGTDYTVTATIVQGANQVLNSIEYVDVLPNPLVMYPFVCCPTDMARAEADAKAKGTGTPLPLKAGLTKVTRKGKFSAQSVDQVFGIVWKLVYTTTVTPISGGTSALITYTQGAALPGVYGSLDTSTDWSITDIQVEPQTYFTVYLKSLGNIIAQTSSELF
jgi:hypothetical protein